MSVSRVLRAMRGALLLLACGQAGVVRAAGIEPWMLAGWDNPAPHFSDLGVRPSDLAASLGQRLIVLPQAARDITIPGADGPRRYAHARFLTAAVVADMPTATLRHRMRDFSGYKNIFPMLTQSEVMATDGRNLVGRYRVDLPLPALASIRIDLRIKHTLESDGSISVLLIDGKAQSLIAMIGGVTDELAGQPVVSRWEFLPVDATHSLLVFTYWDRIELRSYFARKFMEAYPELRVAGPYAAAVGTLEAVHRSVSAPAPARPPAPVAWTQLDALQGLVTRCSANGHVVLLEPESLPGVPLRYATLATRIAVPPEQSRRLATQYARLPEFIKELRRVDVADRGGDADLGLGLKFGFMLLRFSLDLDMHNTWVTPERLEFHRTAGDLAMLSGASEWHAAAGGDDTLMLVSAAHELGDGAPLILRLAHRIVARIPYIDALATMMAEIVVMERMRPWIEAQSGRGALVQR